jgi:GAF domain-containing protein
MNSLPEPGPARESQVVRVFLELADTLVADFDIIDSLTLLATRCVEILDTVATGILLADPDGRLRVMAASNEKARLLELRQLQNDEGPCIEAFASGDVVAHNDLRTAVTLWPRFTPYAVSAGYESVYAIPLRWRGNVIGALNLLKTRAGPLDDSDLALAQALADLATITILQATATRKARQREEQLQHALDSRIVIEQAKGMLGEHAHIDMADAFEHLRTHARNTNTKMTDLATGIVEGQLDLDYLAAAEPQRFSAGSGQRADPGIRPPDQDRN